MARIKINTPRNRNRRMNSANRGENKNQYSTWSTYIIKSARPWGNPHPAKPSRPPLKATLAPSIAPRNTPAPSPDPPNLLGLRCYILFHYYIFLLFDLDQHSTGIILLLSNQNLFLIFTIYSLILVTFSRHINQTMYRKIKNYQELFHSHIRNQRPLSLDLFQFMHCSSLIILQY